ncbi:MAG: hypothetical protein QXG08_06020 [Candidatus Methanomethyliaceae archaeon]
MHLEPKLEYLFKRLRDRMGEQALTSIIEQLYNFTIIEKQSPSKLITRLKSRRGRRKIERYLNIKKS